MLCLLGAYIQFMSSIEAVMLLELFSDIFSNKYNIFTVLDVRLFLTLIVIQ